MSSKQKIWFWIFLAIFIVPEVLWSPVLSFGYELLQSGNTHPLRRNNITNLQHSGLIILVLGVEFIGVVVSLLIISKSIKIKKMIHWILIASMSIFAIANAIVLYFAYVFRNGINIGIF